MSNKHHKVSFNFVNSLPDNQLPIDDEFAFYYVKKFTNYKGSNINIPSLYLYNTHENEFVELTPPTDYIIHTINNKNSVNGTVTLSVDDLLSINPNITQPFKINNNRLFANGELTYFSNLSSSQLTDIDTINRTLILGSDFGDSSTVINSENNIFIGQHQKLQNRLFTNNLIIGNDFQTPEDSTYALNNNMFLGGVWYDKNNPKYVNNKLIENNIFIKNLGYGNIDKYFKFTNKIALPDNTNFVESNEFNNNSLLLSDNYTGEIKKTTLNNLNLDNILTFGNTTDKSINLNSIKLQAKNTFENYNILFDIIESNNVEEVISFGNTTSNTYHTNKTLTDSNIFGKNSFLDGTKTNIPNSIRGSNIFGKNSINLSNQSNIFGVNIYGYYNNSNIFGNINNNKCQTSQTQIFGNNNFVNIEYDELNNIFGSNNFSYNYASEYNKINSNIILGNNNFNNIEKNINNTIVIGSNYGNQDFNSSIQKSYSNSILIGNNVLYKLNSLGIEKDNILAIDNMLNTNNNFTTTPFIYGDFNDKVLTLNGRLFLNTDLIKNSIYDVTFTKVLTQSTDGEIGYINKSEFFNTPIINSKQDSANRVTSWSATTSHSNYPSEKLVKDSLDAVTTQPIKTIDSNATLDDTYHNCIVRITANCNITIPQGLRADFNCVFDAIGNVTATFVAGSRITLSAPYGLILRNDQMCTLYKTSADNFRINGGLMPI